MIIHGIIPARWASTRFPGKPLADIQGKSMIRRVFEQATKATSLSRVVVATDDKRIFDHVMGFGGEAVLTSSAHNTGTSRCAEVALNSGTKPTDAVINIQGDEPFIDPGQIDKLSSLFDDEEVQIATLIKEIKNGEELFNPNIVKVVTSASNKALYFSREAIPFVRGADKHTWTDKTTFYKHIGIYGYRTSVLQQIADLPTGRLETAESLEQLRWLEYGYSIHTAVTDIENLAVDTPEDLNKIINR